jgi:hypothetical protein
MDRSKFYAVLRERNCGVFGTSLSQGQVNGTGRANARKATQRLNEVFGLGIDLESRPEMRGDPFISAHSLFLGCREGWWTGKAWAIISTASTKATRKTFGSSSTRAAWSTGPTRLR